jgi:hypothetical protein
MTTEEVDHRIATALEHILEAWEPFMETAASEEFLRSAIKEEISWLRS